MNTKIIVEHWKTSSRGDIKVAEGLFRLKHYSHCLFFCHLALEKMIKAVFVHRQHTHAPYIHDLVILCRRAGIQLTKEQINALETITNFNIQGRYADYKSRFYKTFNKRPVAGRYLNISTDLIVWLERLLTQK